MAIAIKDKLHLIAINVKILKFPDLSSVVPLHEALSKENQPEIYKITKAISDKANIHPSAVLLYGDDTTYAAGVNKHGAIHLGRGNTKDDKVLEFVYAHELGHKKHLNLHLALTPNKKFKIPYSLLLKTTTNLYGFGLSSYMVMGDNKILDAANWLGEHSWSLLASAVLFNSAMIRTREYMADVFAYNTTGVLPSTALNRVKEERVGVIGNLSKFIGKTTTYLEGGYPITAERDFIVKILGNKPKESSFVERVKSGKTGNDKEIN